MNQSDHDFPLKNEPNFKGKYLFLGQLGSGGMGAVYKARQLALDKLVAIKIIHVNAMSDAAVRRFCIEGKTATRLNHPNLVQVWDLDVTESGHPFLIMEFVEGKTLAEILQEKPQLEEARFDRIFRQLCLGLANVHQNGIIHRDIKPSNIMIVNSPQEGDLVKVMDFGIAKLVGDEALPSLQLTKTGEMIGSPLYMSPEQARGAKGIDNRSDLYALGCVMYEALTGLPPFVGSTYVDTLLKHQNDTVLTMKEASMGRKVTPAVEQMVRKLLEKNPEDRYQSAVDVLNDWPFANADNRHGASHVAGNDNLPKSLPKIFIAILAASTLITGIFFISKKSTNTFSPPRSSPQPQSSSTLEKIAPPVEKKIEQDSNTTKTPTQLLECVESALRHNPDAVLQLSGCCTENDTPLNKALLEALIRQSKEFAAVKAINIMRCDVVNNDLQPLRNLPQLRQLDLRDDIKLRPHFLTGLKLLEDLNVSATNLDSESIESMATLKSLRKLDVSRTQITAKQLALLFGQLKHLEQVSVARCPNISEQEMASIEKKYADISVTFAPFTDINEIHDQIKQGNYTDADNLAVEAARRIEHEANPNYLVLSDLQFIRAEIYKRKIQNELALNFYTKALESLNRTKPDYAKIERIHVSIAELYETQGNWEEALKSRRQLAKLLLEHPCEFSEKSAQLHKCNNLRMEAIASRRVGRIDEEIKFSEACISECSANSLKHTTEYRDSLLSLANINRERKEYKDAIKKYELALTQTDLLSTIDEGVWRDLGDCYFDIGSWQKAEVNFKEFIRRRPAERKSVEKSLVYSLERQNKSREAEEIRAN